MNCNHCSKRGQAALEYLVTYGWGFLVILVVIGSLAYYGLLNPSQYFPERCEFGPQLVCEDSFLEETGGANQIRLSMRNNFGRAINVSEAIVFNACQEEDLLSGGAVTLPPGQRKEIFLDFNLCLAGVQERYVKGDKDLVSITLIYLRNETDAPEHNLTGELFAKVR